MKVIHCGDLHLDSPLTILTSEQRKSRRSELLLNFQRLIEYGIKQGVEAILIAGDLFDSGEVSKGTKDVIFNQIRSAKEITFFYLRGNHDASFSWGERSKVLPDNLIMFSDELQYYQMGEVCIAGVEFTPDNANGIANQVQYERDSFNILMLHGQESKYRCVEETYQVTVPEYAFKNIDYLALGHIHQYREGKIDERGCYCYCGCLEGRGYDECGEKGFVLLDIQHKRMSKSFVPFARRKAHEISVDVTELDTTDAVMKLISNRTATISKDDLVKVELVGKQRPEKMLQIQYMETWLKDNFYSAKVLDKSVIEIRQQDYEYDASLRGTFLRLCEERKLDEETKKAVMSIGLQALSGEDL